MDRVFKRITKSYLDANPVVVLAFSAVLLGVITFTDLALANLSVGLLYLVPIMVASAFMRHRDVVFAAVLCTVLREVIGRFPFDAETPVRVIRSFAGFAGAGLFIAELARNRRLTLEYVRQLEEQMKLREEAQEQLSVLINTSPAAILIADARGKIMLANDSAGQMFGVPTAEFIGDSIRPYLPAIETVPVGAGARALRSTLECRGHRRSGAVFIAQVWFSTFHTTSGPKMAAIVLDASEGLRDREGAGFSSLMRTSRVLIGAVSHSVRNLCAASRMSYTNLARRPELQDDEDVKALGTLIRGLESIASTDLERVADRPTTTVDLATLLDELRVVIEPSYEEAGIELAWHIAEHLPPVAAEHYGLLHAFLNLTQNSERALQDAVHKSLVITARQEASSVDVTFADTAGGVENPERLFQPFNPGASGTGLGLYVSRAVVRSFSGDLSYEPVPGGSCFRLTLRAAYNRSAAHAATGGG